MGKLFKGGSYLRGDTNEGNMVNIIRWVIFQLQETFVKLDFEQK